VEFYDAYQWNCKGLNGGATASCNADYQTEADTSYCGGCLDSGKVWCEGGEYDNICDVNNNLYGDCIDGGGEILNTKTQCIATYDSCTFCLNRGYSWCEDENVVGQGTIDFCFSSSTYSTCGSGGGSLISSLTSCPDYVAPSGDSPSSGDSPVTPGSSGDGPSGRTNIPGTQNPALGGILNNSNTDEKKTERPPITIAGKTIDELVVDKWFWISLIGGIAIIIVALVGYRIVRKRLLNPAN
jgi:hypothetical protein